MKRLVLAALLVTATLSLFAQDSTRTRREAKNEKKEQRHQRINAMIKQEEEGALIYSKQSVFGIQLRTNGYGIFYELGRLKTRRKTTLYAAELTEIKDPKEEKNPAGFFSFNNPFIYGKINNFYQLKLGFGQQYLIGQKGNKNGVAVTAVYHGGLSLGLLRPYYLDVDDDTAGTRTIKYSTQDSALFLGARGKILGSAGIGKGWGEMKLRPGAYAKGAIRFDYGRYNELVSGIEIGLSVDVYSEKIPIILFAKQRQVFFQGHIAILFGKRK